MSRVVVGFIDPQGFVHVGATAPSGLLALIGGDWILYVDGDSRPRKVYYGSMKSDEAQGVTIPLRRDAKLSHATDLQGTWSVTIPGATGWSGDIHTYALGDQGLRNPPDVQLFDMSKFAFDTTDDDVHIHQVVAGANAQ